jgi:hypothetical protein
MLRSIVLMFAILVSQAAWAEDSSDAEADCIKAARNSAVFERAMVKSLAEARPADGAFACTWTFESPDAADTAPLFTAHLESMLFKSPVLARFSIAADMLPENRHGRTVEGVAGLGDAALSRRTIVAGRTTLLEFEVAKGRRHFLLTVTPRRGEGVSERLYGQSLSFLGRGIARF